MVHWVAPDFSLQDLNGQPLELANYRGKVVLLDFWATWCTPCRGEDPSFVEFQNKYREQGLQVIGISMDDGPKPVREFYQEFKMNYPVALGNEKVAKAYGGVLGLADHLPDRPRRPSCGKVCWRGANDRPGSGDQDSASGQVRPRVVALRARLGRIAYSVFHK